MSYKSLCILNKIKTDAVLGTKASPQAGAEIIAIFCPAERNGGTRAPKEVEPLTLHIQQHTKKNLNGLY